MIRLFLTVVLFEAPRAIAADSYESVPPGEPEAISRTAALIEGTSSPTTRRRRRIFC